MQNIAVLIFDKFKSLSRIQTSQAHNTRRKRKLNNLSQSDIPPEMKNRNSSDLDFKTTNLNTHGKSTDKRSKGNIEYIKIAEFMKPTHSSLGHLRRINNYRNKSQSSIKRL